MNNKMIFAALAVGSAIGAFITWRCIKKKYERISQDEINSVKEVFQKGNDKKQYDISKNLQEKESEIKSKIKLNTDYSNIKTKISNDILNPTPYVITPDEFGEFEDYETISLTYYADRILTDENDELIDNVDEIVGFDSLNHFGEYEEDSVFVRNDAKKCDYEILKDIRRYSNVVKSIPYKMEVK